MIEKIILYVVIILFAFIISFISLGLEIISIYIKKMENEIED